MKATKKSKATNARAIAQPDSKSALHVTDIQNDFCPGGALGVPGADAIIPIVNDYIRPRGLHAPVSLHDSRVPVALLLQRVERDEPS